MAGGAEGPVVVEASPAPPKKQRRGIVSRLWWWIFGSRSEDYEKRLQHLSKEEAAVHARMKRRAQSSRRMIRNIIVFSVILEVVAVVYAILTTRSADLNWQIRATRVLPMFVLPGLSSVIYSTLVSFTRMFDRKDQKTLDKLRAERKAKIDELKERTDFYNTQQLIQKYDLDPAAKAAAARILASKLGADSDLKVYVGDEPNTCAPLVKSSDAKAVQTTGLRSRKQSHARSISTVIYQSVSETPNAPQEIPSRAQKAVEHYKGSASDSGGWIARIASLLVGDDRSQCYALICGNCHMHNGLARKEEFPHIRYYCPQCHALNTSWQSGEHDSGSRSGQGNSFSRSEVTNDLPKVPEQLVGKGGEKEHTSEATS